MKFVCILLGVATAWTSFGQVSPPQNLRIIQNTEYFVAPSGSSTNSGSAKSPWSLDYALTKLAPGVKLTLLSGVYRGPFQIYSVNGIPTYPITIKSQVKWGAVIANSTSFGIAASSYPGYEAGYLVFDGLCLSNNATDGIGAWRNTVIRNCWAVNNGMQGINISSPTSCSNTVEYCLSEKNGWSDPAGGHYHGIYFCGQANVVRGNVVRNNTGYGIHLYTEDPDVRNDQNFVYNNLTYGQVSRYGVALWNANWIDQGSLPGTNYFFNNTILDGIQIAWGKVGATNNIVLASPVNPSFPISIDSDFPAVVTGDFNVSTLPLTPAGPHDKVVSGLGFVDSANGLYWLSTSSAARGAASPSTAAGVDFFGSLLSSPIDVGAFQYNALLTSDSRNLLSTLAAPDYWAVH